MQQRNFIIINVSFTETSSWKISFLTPPLEFHMFASLTLDWRVFLRRTLFTKAFLVGLVFKKFPICNYLNKNKAYPHPIIFNVMSRFYFVGTMIHAPPEWFNDQVYWAESTTVWQIGVVLYDMLHSRQLNTNKYITNQQPINNLLSKGEKNTAHVQNPS